MNAARLRVIAVLAPPALIALVACGKGREQPAAGAAASSPSVPAAPAAGATTAVQPAAPAAEGSDPGGMITLTPADIESYRRAMRAELAVVRARAADLRRARSSSDSVNAMFALSDQSAREQAAVKASGLSAGRFAAVTQAVDAVLARWGNQRNVEAMLKDADTMSMPPELRERARQGLKNLTQGFGDLPRANVDLVLPHAAELDSLRVLPAAVALKAARG